MWNPSLLISFLAPVAWNANIHPTSTFDFHLDIVSFSFALCLDVQERDNRVVAPPAIMICFMPLLFLGGCNTKQRRAGALNYLNRIRYNMPGCRSHRHHGGRECLF